MPRKGRRVTLATGIYKDQSGVSVRVGAIERRFGLDTPLVILKQCRADLLKLHEKKKATGKATLRRDCARYLTRKAHLSNQTSISAELDAWCDLYGSTSRHAITKDDVLAARNEWKAQGKASKTINHRVNRLRALYRELDGPQAWSPTDGIAPLPVHRKPIQRVSPQIVLDVLANMRKARHHRQMRKTRARLMVIASTGMRPSEVGRAEPGDVDLQQRVWVPRTGKGGYSPGIYLNDDMLAAWTEFAAANAWGPFDSSSFARRLREYGWPAGVRPYQMRHSTGMALSEAGHDLDDIAAHFGHKRRETTRANYVPVLNSRMQRMSESIDGRFGGFVPHPRSTNSPDSPSDLEGKQTVPDHADRAKTAG